MSIDLLIVVWAGGAILLMVMFGAIGRRFYLAHRERYGTWRDPHDEYVATGRIMPLSLLRDGWKAYKTRADDEEVERLRKATIGSVIACGAWVFGFPLLVAIQALVSR